MEKIQFNKNTFFKLKHDIYCIISFLSADILAEANIDLNSIPIVMPRDDISGVLPYFNQDVKLILIQIKAEIKSLKDKQEKSLSQIQETTNLILAKINSAQYGNEDVVIQDNKIRQYLPLTSIQNLLDFENTLKNNKEAFMQLVSRFVY